MTRTLLLAAFLAAISYTSLASNSDSDKLRIRDDTQLNFIHLYELAQADRDFNNDQRFHRARNFRNKGSGHRRSFDDLRSNMDVLVGSQNSHGFRNNDEITYPPSRSSRGIRLSSLNDDLLNNDRITNSRKVRGIRNDHGRDDDQYYYKIDLNPEKRTGHGFRSSNQDEGPIRSVPVSKNSHGGRGSSRDDDDLFRMPSRGNKGGAGFRSINRDDDDLLRMKNYNNREISKFRAFGSNDEKNLRFLVFRKSYGERPLSRTDDDDLFIGSKISRKSHGARPFVRSDDDRFSKKSHGNRPLSRIENDNLFIGSRNSHGNRNEDMRQLVFYNGGSRGGGSKFADDDAIERFLVDEVASEDSRFPFGNRKALQLIRDDDENEDSDEDFRFVVLSNDYQIPSKGDKSVTYFIVDDDDVEGEDYEVEYDEEDFDEE